MTRPPHYHNPLTIAMPPDFEHATVSVKMTSENFADVMAVVAEMVRNGAEFTPINRDDLHGELAAAPKCTAKDINRLIEQIRSGQPPELPKGIREKHYRDPALPNLYIRLYNTGVASWVVQWKQLGQQQKKRLGDVLVLDRLDTIKTAKDLLAKVQL